MASTGSRKFQAPKGTRDFYPQEMAVRRYIEGVWRQTSINHGFDEIEGPMFEDIDLYKHKSGPGIVSEIFQVFSGKDEKEIAALRAGGAAPFALRPEFTPTLARMVAAKAAELPRPIKWFAIPQHFRAERPQRGRLREFMQWNVDFIGDDSPKADAEVIATAVCALQQFGLTSETVRIRLNDRKVVDAMIRVFDLSSEEREPLIQLIDQYDQMNEQEFIRKACALGILENIAQKVWTALRENDARGTDPFEPVADLLQNDLPSSLRQASLLDQNVLPEAQKSALPLVNELKNLGVGTDWWNVDISIARGLAYYTGTVFEIHETTGAERAIAGGGRYDNLIESFGGPSLPACGFGMGDVVLANILHDKNLLPEEVYMKPLRPHAFAIALDDAAEPIMRQTVSQLRRDGFHVRHSYKTTRNVGKLLGDASKARAMSAIIFGKDLAANPPQVDFKDLQSGEQRPISLAELQIILKTLIAKNE